MATDYEIKARLSVDAKAAANGLGALSQKLGSLGQALRGTQSGLGSMVGQMVAFGGAYLGVTAMVGAFRSLTASAFEFEKQVGAARLGLQTVMSQIEGTRDNAGEWTAIGFERAAGLATQTYNVLQEMAVESSATSAELLNIFQNVYGAGRSAGASMETVYSMTQNAATAAAALGVDFQQASRDMGMMLRGSAGMQVKMFSTMRAMNAITISAEEFNDLSPADRLATLQRALQGFEAANAAYGRSLPGAVSTSQDLFELFRASLFGPLFARIAESLNRMNAYLIANKTAIKGYLTTIGYRFADFFDATVTKATRAFAYITANWDSISARAKHALAEFQRISPIVLSWGLVFVKMRLAATALGIAFSGASTVLSAVSGLSSLAGSLGVLGGATAAGGTAAAAGGVGAAGGAAGGALSALGAALSPLLPVIAAIGAAIASVAVAFDMFGEEMNPMVAEFMAIMGDVGGDLMATFEGMWTFIKPILGFLGAILGGVLLVALKGIALILRVVSIQFRILGSILGWIGENVLMPFAQGIGEAWTQLMHFLSMLFDQFNAVVRRILALIPGDGPSDADLEAGSTYRAPRGGLPGYTDERGNLLPAVAPPTTPNDPTGGIPNGRPTTVNDFRGSKITVEQSFREADPDRVAVRMIEDIQKFAEQRIQSGFAPAFTRG